MPNVHDLLNNAYVDELETVANYLSLSVALDGLQAEELKESLEKEVPEELGHARSIAHRLKELGHSPPGSLDFKFQQASLQPPKDTTNLEPIIQGLLQAEERAIGLYRSIIDAANEADDPVTADLATKILADEEEHAALVRGYLKAL